MARGDFLDAQLVDRIKKSTFELTVRYPPERAVAPAPAPAGAPLSPLTGPKTTPTLLPPAPVPAHPPVTMKCLWLDVASTLTTGDSPSIERLKQSAVGLVEGATALARVLVEDAAVDPAKPFGKTVFDACEVVEFHERRYRVVRVDRVSRSFANPVTYSLWLAGSQVE